LADVVKVKKGSGSTAHWSINFIRLSGWLRRCFTLLITPLDIDGIAQNGGIQQYYSEDSSTVRFPYAKIIYKRTWVASLAFQAVQAT